MPDVYSPWRGRAALVTGGAGGIGAALCRALVSAGASVAACDVDGDTLSELARSVGAPLVPIACNVADISDCERAVAQARTRFGAIDLVIANAGISARASFADTEVDVVRRVMEVNFFGALNTVKAALPDLISSRGHVVVVSSVAGLVPLYGRSAYSASKHALHGLFETARTELADRGVEVTMVCPSFTRSGLEARAIGGDGQHLGRARTAVGRTREPEEVARQILAAAASKRRQVVMSPVGQLALWMSRLAPGLYDRLMVSKMRRELDGTDSRT